MSYNEVLHVMDTDNYKGGAFSQREELGICIIADKHSVNTTCIAQEGTYFVFRKSVVE